MLLLLVALALVSSSLAQSACQSCIASNKTWCVDEGECQPALCFFCTQPCKTQIFNALNCPMTPQSGYEYTDDFGRNVAMPLLSACYINDPTPCFKNQLPATTLSKSIYAPCSQIGPNTTCHVYTAYDPTKKAIMVAFRGTIGAIQLTEELESFFEKKEPFFNNGHVFKYFYDAFYLMWNEGLESSVRNLKYLYPDYNIWIFGHSLGGAMASVCASHILKTNIYTPQQLRLVTFGQPRTGDKDWATWHDNTFLYSYRIVHHKDIVPHIPPRGGPDGVWHHRYEIWYNNNMTVTDTYKLCAEDDGLYCSNTQIDLNSDDHVVYFDKDMGAWSSKGCPKDQ